MKNLEEFRQGVYKKRDDLIKKEKRNRKIAFSFIIPLVLIVAIGTANPLFRSMEKGMAEDSADMMPEEGTALSLTIANVTKIEAVVDGDSKTFTDEIVKEMIAIMVEPEEESVEESIFSENFMDSSVTESTTSLSGGIISGGLCGKIVFSLKDDDGNILAQYILEGAELTHNETGKTRVLTKEDKDILMNYLF